MTSGKIPNFGDVILNFGATEISDQNWLDIAINNGKKAVFYGDDTWLKLFPNRFIRFEGTTSFFVSVSIIPIVL